MKNKIYVIVSIIILIVAIIGTTLALVYFRGDTTSINLSFEANLGEYINYKSGDSILGDEDDILNTSSDYTSGLSTEIEFWKTEVAHNMDIYGHIYLEINNGSDVLLNSEGLKWAVSSNDILISEGNFIGYSEGGSIPVLVNHKLLSSLTKFKVYIWLDENSYIDPSVENEALTVTVKCEASSGEYDAFGLHEFDYTGNVETTTLTAGTYFLEVWGAQGGYGMNETYRGGYGGYSSGYITLNESTSLYVAVGGQGGNGTAKVNTLNAGGFNGGGNSYGTTNKYVGSGGGATHIALSTGALSTLSEKIGDILIVAGGGGAGGYQSASFNSTGGDAGGYIGNSGITNSSYTVGTGGTQTSAGTGHKVGAFGQGANTTSNSIGGGGGFYGGGAGKYASGSGGGSGYIGNPLLTDKVMYCYNCKDSSSEEDETNIKTISTLDVSEEAVSNYAKIGNGYAKILNVLSKPIKIISRKSITYGTDYNFMSMAMEELDTDLTIIDISFDNANEFSVGEYQIRYIVVDSNNNEYTYYQKIEIVN